MWPWTARGGGRRPRVAWSRAAAAWLLLAACGGGPAAPPGPPNLVLVIGDDHGYPDFGFMGSPVVRTPRLDALAAEGVVFPVGYSTASVCQPALRTLLTGLVPLQFQARERGLRRSRPREARGEPAVASLATLPRLLGERGYTSFQAGKLWEGHYASAGFDAGMVEQAGFDGSPQATRLVRETLEPVFEFLEGSREGPFFLWFAPMLPHLPHDAPARFRELYPDAPSGARGYYASISWFDDAVGHLVDRLRTLGLARDTLLVYVVDNGWDPSPPERPELALQGGPRGKLSLHELGLRTPVLLYAPGRLAPARRTELVSLEDVFPTLLDYAGAPAPADRLGHSLRPLLEGRGAWPRERLIGWVPSVRERFGRPGSTAGGLFWRDARWHYLEPLDGTPALYDLAADPQEQRDVLARHPEVVSRARAELQDWLRRAGT